VEALLNETLYVTLKLCDLCSEDDFTTSLVKAICSKAVSQLPNSSELLSQLVLICQRNGYEDYYNY